MCETKLWSLSTKWAIFCMAVSHLWFCERTNIFFWLALILYSGTAAFSFLSLSLSFNRVCSNDGIVKVALNDNINVSVKDHRATSNRRWLERLCACLYAYCLRFKYEIKTWKQKNYCRVENDCQDQTILWWVSQYISKKIFHCCCFSLQSAWLTNEYAHTHIRVISYTFSHCDSNERILCSVFFLLPFLFFLFHLNLDKCSLLDAMCHSLNAKERMRWHEILLLRSLIMLLF